MRSATGIPLCLLTLALVQCASGPAIKRAMTLGAGERAEIVFTEGSMRLSMINASSISPETAYSKASGDIMTKVIADEQMQRLLDGLSALDFFSRAEPARSREAKAAIEVVHRGRRHVMARRPLKISSVKDVGEFHQCAALVRYFYDNARAYHTGVNIRGNDFKALNEKLNKDAAERAKDRR